MGEWCDPGRRCRTRATLASPTCRPGRGGTTHSGLCHRTAQARPSPTTPVPVSLPPEGVRSTGMGVSPGDGVDPCRQPSEHRLVFEGIFSSAQDSLPSLFQSVRRPLVPGGSFGDQEVVTDARCLRELEDFEEPASKPSPLGVDTGEVQSHAAGDHRSRRQPGPCGVAGLRETVDLVPVPATGSGPAAVARGGPVRCRRRRTSHATPGTRPRRTIR